MQISHCVAVSDPLPSVGEFIRTHMTVGTRLPQQEKNRRTSAGARFKVGENGMGQYGPRYRSRESHKGHGECK